jgi:cytochrome c556
LSELLRLDDVAQRPEQFKVLLQGSKAEAQKLESALRDGKAETATATLDRISSRCTACHLEFRDKPLGEK